MSFNILEEISHTLKDRYGNKYYYDFNFEICDIWIRDRALLMDLKDFSLELKIDCPERPVKLDTINIGDPLLMDKICTIIEKNL